MMVKFKWTSNKILVQRLVLLAISGAISCGILYGYLNYYKQVSEYMQSITYRQMQEATKDYHAKIMKNNRKKLASGENESSKKPSD